MSSKSWKLNNYNEHLRNLDVKKLFHTEATVSIGLKTYSEWEHPYYSILCQCCETEGAKTLISILSMQARLECHALASPPPKTCKL